MNRLEDRLGSRMDGLGTRMDGLERNLWARIDQLTERYIAHLERHPR